MKFKSIALALGVFALAVSAQAKTIIVSNNPALPAPCNTATQTTVNGAYAVAAAGDAIHVCPGTYPEAVLVTKPVSFSALSVGGSSLVRLRPTVPVSLTDVFTGTTVNGVVIVDGTANVYFNGFTFDGSQDHSNACDGIDHVDVYYANSTGAIMNSAVGWAGLNPDGSLTGCQEGHGIYTSSGSGGKSYLTVTNTSVHDFDKSGIEGVGGGTTVVAKNNTVTGAGATTATAQNGIEIIYGAKGTIENNIVTSVNYTPTSSSATGILFFQAADFGVASNNIISDTNGAVYFYQSNKGTANNNTVSKSTNYGALAAYQSNSTAFKANTVVGTSSVEGLDEPVSGDPAQPAIYICGSKSTVSGNHINDALVGVQVDETSIDSCTGSSANSVSGNTYVNVGINSQTATNANTQFVNAKAMHSATFGKPSPSK